MSVSTSLRNLRRVLVGTPYGRYSIGNLVTSSGVWMLRLSAGWLGWELTQSATWLGVLAFADLFPTIACAPIAGVLADRMDRIALLRRIVGAGIVVSALTALAFYGGILGIWALLAMTFLQGVITSLAQPLRLTIVSELVAREDVAAAVAINAISFNIARFVGPAIAGITIVVAGVGPTFILNVLFSLIFLMQLRGLSGRRGGSFAQGSIFSNMTDGLRYLARQGTVLPLFLQAACVGLCIRPVAELLPAISDLVYSAGAAGLTFLTCSMGIGAALGGIWFAGLGSLGRVVTIIGINGLLAVAATLCLLTAPVLDLGIAPGMAAMLVVGFTVVSSGIATQTTIQLVVDEEQRGRAMSSYAMIVRAAPALGALIVGGLTEIIGVHFAVAFATPVCAVVTAILLVRRRTLQSRIDAALS